MASFPRRQERVCEVSDTEYRHEALPPHHPSPLPLLVAQVRHHLRLVPIMLGHPQLHSLTQNMPTMQLPHNTMTDQQIRLQFGEMNAAEMRLARAIVGWHEAEQAQLIQDWADTDTAVREICRKAGLDVDGSPAHVPDIPELVERLAKENAKLRAAADGLAEALGACTFKDWFASELTGKVTVTIDSDKARDSLASYQALKP